MTPADRAQKARLSASARYRLDALMKWGEGNLIHDIDPDGAVAAWLDGMKALDAAETVEKGLK